jgi:hypothetical protein
VTLVLLINGEPVARLAADTEKVCTERDVAAALAKIAASQGRDLPAARGILKRGLADFLDDGTHGE